MPNELTGQEAWDSAWRIYRGTDSRNLAVRELDRYLASVLSMVPLSGSVIELGGAPGRIIERMHQLRPDLRYDCLDFSRVGLDRAAQLYAASNIKGELIEGDVMTYSDGLGTYDLACSHGLVEHFGEFDGVIARHFEFAKPGGLVSIAVPNYAVFPVLGLLRRFCKRTLETHNIECMFPEVLEKAVRDAGGVVLASGFMGAAILPCSSPDKSFGGKLYGIIARSWNLFNSLIGLASRDRLVARWWRHQVYVVARKPGG